MRATAKAEAEREEKIRAAILDLRLRRGDLAQRLSRWDTLMQLRRTELTESQRADVEMLAGPLHDELAAAGPTTYGGIRYEAVGGKVRTYLPS